MHRMQGKEAAMRLQPAGRRDVQPVSPGHHKAKLPRLKLRHNQVREVGQTVSNPRGQAKKAEGQM